MKKISEFLFKIFLHILIGVMTFKLSLCCEVISVIHVDEEGALVLVTITCVNTGADPGLFHRGVRNFRRYPVTPSIRTEKCEQTI